MHMQADELERYALGQLAEDASAAVESHLATCVDCGIQLEESRRAIGEWNDAGNERGYSLAEKRRSPRLETDDSAVLTIIEPERPTRVRVRALDASREGMKLNVPGRLLPGSFVQVYVRELFILAEVRYCVPAGEAFHAGVLIHDVFPACG